MTEPTEPELRVKLLEILESIDYARAEAHPRRGGDRLSHGETVVVALLTGCARFFSSVRILLTEGHAEEAKLVCRTLLEDATTLAYLHKHKHRLEELALGLVYQSLRRLKGLHDQATFLDLQQPPRRAQQIEEDLAAVTRLATEMGTSPSKLPRLPHVNAMLQELDADKLYWFYQEQSHFVHSSTYALASRLEWRDDTVTVRMESDLRALLRVGFVAGESMLTAVIAAGLILGWESTDRLGEHRTQARSMLADLIKEAKRLEEEEPSERPASAEVDTEPSRELRLGMIDSTSAEAHQAHLWAGRLISDKLDALGASGDGEAEYGAWMGTLGQAIVQVFPVAGWDITRYATNAAYLVAALTHFSCLAIELAAANLTAGPGRRSEGSGDLGPKTTTSILRGIQLAIERSDSWI